MMNYISHKPILSLMMVSVFLFSCVREFIDHDMSAGSDDIKIVGSRSEAVSKSVPPNYNFDEGICYRLWAYDNTSDDYIFNNKNDAKGIVAKESYGHYIEIDDTNRSLLVDKFTIYGLTDNKTKDASAAFMPLDNTLTGYNLSSENSQEPIPSGLESENNQLTDFYRGEFKYIRDNMPIDSKGLIVMNFSHIMSQLKISILQQPDENTGEIYDNLIVSKIELEGDYRSMNYDVKTNIFQLSEQQDNETPYVRTLWEMGSSSTENPNNIPGSVTTEVKRFVNATVFPTLQSQSNDKEYYLYLTLAGEDAGKFVLDEQHRVKIRLTESGLGERNMSFLQNYSYHIQVFFMSGNVHVIAIKPEVYPWIDGETENGEQGDKYEEVSLGNTLLFDNLLWADRNLGATEFSPANEALFRNCTGFYYQFQRNIPFFPASLNERAKVFPVTSNEIANSQVPEYKYIVNGSWQYDNIGGFIQKIEDIGNVDNYNNYAGYAIYTSGQGLPGNLKWGEDVSTQPTPPGWRIPSADEFLSIMPSCPAAGNITFLSWVEIGVAAGHNHPNQLADESEKPYDVISVKVPYDKDYDYYPAFNRYRYWSTDNGYWIYSNNKNQVIPDNITGDPSERYSSVYVISKSDETLDKVSKPLYKKTTAQGHETDPSWGTIYAIKKVGTDEAYRIRWHIERPASDKDYYVLVISKYTASRTDQLLFRDEHRNSPYHYRNYEWNNPSAVMYIPIVGMIGSNSWREGQLGNFGTEAILLTTDKIDANNFKTLRIKIAGDNATNQYIFVSQDFGGCGGQLRLVRDITTH